MIRATFLLGLVSSCLFACGGTEPAPATPAPPAGPDAHGIAADEQLVASADVPANWSSTVAVQVARLEKPVDPGGEGIFFPARGGSEMKTKFHWSSHVAAKDEIKPGQLVACYRDIEKDGVYTAPDAKGRAGHWELGHVSDVAEIEKGIAKVGNMRCQIGALRIAAP